MSLGREAGIRPQDLVGAIVGGIDIADRFSIVEVPSASAREVVDALNGTRLRGRKAKARLLKER